MKKIYEIKNLRCGVWDEVVEQKGTLPLLKVVLEAKTQQKNMFFFFNDQYFPF